MQEKDVEHILKLENVAFHNPWNEEQIRYELMDNEYAFQYVLEEDENCIGFIDFWITFDSASLAKVAIFPMYRKQGYARKLMNFMIAECEQAMCENITLEVRVSNTSAIALYETLGFININIKKQYYDNGEDALYMMKPLGGILK